MGISVLTYKGVKSWPACSLGSLGFVHLCFFRDKGSVKSKCKPSHCLYSSHTAAAAAIPASGVTKSQVIKIPPGRSHEYFKICLAELRTIATIAVLHQAYNQKQVMFHVALVILHVIFAGMASSGLSRLRSRPSAGSHLYI